MAASRTLTKLRHRFERFFDNGANKRKEKQRAELDDGFDNQPLVSLEKATDPLVPIVSNVKTMVAYAKRQCKSLPSDGLSIDQSTAIILYTMEWFPTDQCLFKMLNKTLREGTQDELKPWLLYLKLFNVALARLPSVRQTVY